MLCSRILKNKNEWIQSTITAPKRHQKTIVMNRVVDPVGEEAELVSAERLITRQKCATMPKAKLQMTVFEYYSVQVCSSLPAL